MLNVAKRAEEGRQMLTGDNWRYDLGIDDIQNIVKATNAKPTNELFHVICMAFHLGLVAGKKIAQKQAKA